MFAPKAFRLAIALMITANSLARQDLFDPSFPSYIKDQTSGKESISTRCSVR